jgi:hypothetical protein
VSERKIKIYVARAMSGRPASEVVKEAAADKKFLEAAGFQVLDPVSEEGVKPSKKLIQSSKQAMDKYWKRDKELIREADVLLNMSPHLPSMGVIREHGYSRYHLWKKTVSVFPHGMLPQPGSIAVYEDDYVTDNILDAMVEIYRTHGTLFKRLKWRLAMYRRCWLKALIHRAGEWK